MNALFSQGDAAAGYSANDYLKVGGTDTLPFSGSNTLETENEIV